MQWITDHARPVMDSLIYSVLGTVILLAAFWIIQMVLPFSMKKEIEEDQNTSLGIILGSFIIALAIIISSAIKG